MSAATHPGTTVAAELARLRHLLDSVPSDGEELVSAGKQLAAQGHQFLGDLSSGLRSVQSSVGANLVASGSAKADQTILQLIATTGRHLEDIDDLSSVIVNLGNALIEAHTRAQQYGPELDQLRQDASAFNGLNDPVGSQLHAQFEAALHQLQPEIDALHESVTDAEHRAAVLLHEMASRPKTTSHHHRPSHRPPTRRLSGSHHHPSSHHPGTHHPETNGTPPSGGVAPVRVSKPASHPHPHPNSGPMSVPAKGPLLSGKVSWFGGPNDSGDNGVTASGIPESHPGIAVYDQATLRGYWRVTFPNGRVLILQQTDIGPAPWTGRKVDVLYSALPAAGYTENNFPTDATVKYQYLGMNKPPGAL